MVTAFLGCSMAFSGLKGLLHEASLESLRARVWGSFKGSVLSGPVRLQLWELGFWVSGVVCGMQLLCGSGV